MVPHLVPLPGLPSVPDLQLCSHPVSHPSSRPGLIHPINRSTFAHCLHCLCLFCQNSSSMSAQLFLSPLLPGLLKADTAGVSLGTLVSAPCQAWDSVHSEPPWAVPFCYACSFLIVVISHLHSSPCKLPLPVLPTKSQQMTLLLLQSESSH